MSRTPGPWRVDPNSFDEVAIVTEAGAVVALVYAPLLSPSPGQIDPERPEVDAEHVAGNGRLLAAAPDLLAACLSWVAVGWCAMAAPKKAKGKRPPACPCDWHEARRAVELALGTTERSRTVTDVTPKAPKKLGPPTKPPGEKKVLLPARVHPVILDRLDAAAAKRGMGRSPLIELILSEWLDRKKS